MRSYYNLDYYKSIKFYLDKVLVLLVTITVMLVPALSYAAPSELVLQDRLMEMIPFKADAGRDQLMIITRSEALDEAQVRFIQKVAIGPLGVLTVIERKALPAAVTAFARCAAQNGPDILLGLDGSGVVDLMIGGRLVTHPTLFRHRAKDSFPAVPLCFDLFKDERPALVVPVIQGVTIFRWNNKRAIYELHAEVEVRAQSRYFWQVTGMDPNSVERQNASVNLDFPDNFITDFNGDGRKDMCFAYGESLQCVLQSEQGFKGATRSRFNFDILTAAEKDDSSIRVRDRLLDVDGDGLADLILQKTIWNLTGMETTLYVYRNKAGTGFKGAADQTIRRSGYFAYHDFLDLNGDGLPELVSPVADMNFADMVRILVSRTVSIDNIVYSNDKGTFAAKPVSLFSHSFPVNFRNATSLYSALPAWNVRAGSVKLENSVVGLFFPEKSKIAAVQVPKSNISEARVLWTRDADIGDSMVVIDLDGDGIDELWTGSPRVSEKSKKILRTVLQ